MGNQNETGMTIPIEQFQCYVGAKIISATPMTEFSFHELQGKPLPENEDRPGYMVEYPNNYRSWSPKEVFEEAYRPVSDGEKDLLMANFTRVDASN